MPLVGYKGADKKLYMPLMLSSIYSQKAAFANRCREFCKIGVHPRGRSPYYIDNFLFLCLFLFLVVLGAKSKT